MKRVCAWCGRELEESDQRNDQTTHGLCRDCRSQFFNPKAGGKQGAKGRTLPDDNEEEIADRS